MPQSLAAVYVHIVFSTKERHPYLADAEIRAKLYAGLASISRRLDCPTIRIGGIEDHVHILGRQSRIVTLADWVRDLKRLSSPWLKKQNVALSDFAWQSGYGAFSVEAGRIESLANYILRQAEHHERLTFQEEYRNLLRDARLDWDEAYVWD